MLTKMDLLLLDIYRSGSIKIHNVHKGYFDRRSVLLSLGKRHAGVYIFTVEKSKEIFNILGVDLKKVTTEQLKREIVLFFKIKNNTKLFVTLTYLLNKHYKLTMKCLNKEQTSFQYILSDGNGIFDMIFKELNFKYVEVPRKYDRAKVLRITQGSFFINGQWVHVG